MNEILKKIVKSVPYKKVLPIDVNDAYKEGFMEGAQYALSHQWIRMDESLPDRGKYDWVLIQIQMDDGFMCVPNVGEIRSDGYWHCAEYDEIYKNGESFEKEMGCKVIAWMPIPKFETKEKK